MNLSETPQTLLATLFNPIYSTPKTKQGNIRGLS